MQPEVSQSCVHHTPEIIVYNDPSKRTKVSLGLGLELG